jgi:hypothetical protein
MRVYLILVALIVMLASLWDLEREHQWANSWLPNLGGGLVVLLVAAVLVDRAIEQERARNERQIRLPMRVSASHRLDRLLLDWMNYHALHLPMDRDLARNLQSLRAGADCPVSETYLAIWLTAVAKASRPIPRRAMETAREGFVYLHDGIERVRDRYAWFLSPTELAIFDLIDDDLSREIHTLATYHRLHLENPDAEYIGLEQDDFDSVVSNACTAGTRYLPELIAITRALVQE